MKIPFAVPTVFPMCHYILCNVRPGFSETFFTAGLLWFPDARFYGIMESNHENEPSAVPQLD